MLVLVLSTSHLSAGWIWDRDSNRIDDRIEATNREGIAAAFERGDPATGRLIFAVSEDGGLLRYGVYVGYFSQPGPTELEALRASGVSTEVFYAFRTIPYVQMALTFAEIQRVASLPGVERVEALEMVYPVNNNATKTSGATDSRFRRFPTVQGNLAITGKGVVVSILDTGVNDAFDPVTGFPGHEAFKGKFIAGGNFYSGQPLLNTTPEQSENPVDRGVDSVHGTHVAGTTLGTGGPSRVFGGVAPGSLLVDQKVLSDAGAGFGSAAGVEWAILNKEKYNIRVLNLSLGGLANSDGKDAGSRAINAAFDAGIIAVVATGNDSKTGYIASPSAADKAFSIGSLEDQNSIGRDDDKMAAYSNEGPRLSDGDADFADEMKPLVAAPGSGIVSSDGLLTTDGRQYKPLSGTSMATPHVAGIVALMLEANPALTPAQVWDILKHTSEHRASWGKTAAAAQPYPQGDPNYHPSGGWGQVDAYAAVKEALRIKGDRASQTQVVYINAAPASDASAAIDLTWRSQRETNLSGYDLYRADDVSGAPGTYVQVNGSRIPGIGQAAIEGVNNRNTYSFRDAGVQFGRTYWYRVVHTSSDPTVGSVDEPAMPVTLGQPKAVARIQYSITHNAFDNDLLVLLGSGSQAERARLVLDGKSALQADRVVTEQGEATSGNKTHEFTIDLTSVDQVEQFLPPSKKNPWFLSVKEGGFVNRTGRVNAFSMTLFDAAGNPTTVYRTGDLTPQRTVEDQTTTLWIPDDPNVFVPGDSPTINEIEPASAAQTANRVRVEIFGAEFTPGATVTFAGGGITVHSAEVIAGVKATSSEYKSGSSMVITLSVASNAAPGPRDVTVTNIDGKTGTLRAGFTVLASPNGCSPSLISVDNADAAIEYTGGWHLKEDANASSGTYQWKAARGGKNDVPASARFVFKGSQATYFYATSTTGGSADVYLDGNLVRTLSYAGSSKKPEFGSSVTFGGLAEGTHELRIVLRSGTAYIDGFQISSCQSADAVEEAVTTRAITAVTSGDLGALTSVLLRTIQTTANDQAMSVIVSGLNDSMTVNILNPAGSLVATGGALLTGGTLAGVDTTLSGAGIYTIQIVNAGGVAQAVEVSIARTVRVK